MATGASETKDVVNAKGPMRVRVRLNSNMPMVVLSNGKRLLAPFVKRSFSKEKEGKIFR